MAMLIRGGQILAGTPATLSRADVLIEGDRIAAVGPGLAVPAGAQLVDASGSIVLPGMGNAHTHAASHLSRGRAGNWTLEDLLTHSAANYGFRTPEDEYLSAAIGAIEMLKTGCTSAYDLYMAVPAITDEAFEAVVRAYTDVVRARPGDETAAWNLEFVSRVRAQFAQSRQPAFPEPETRGLAGDLPLGPTLHGAPGEPPPGADMKQFKVVVPMRPDERKQLPQGASEGEPRKKRG